MATRMTCPRALSTELLLVYEHFGSAVASIPSLRLLYQYFCDSILREEVVSRELTTVLTISDTS